MTHKTSYEKTKNKTHTHKHEHRETSNIVYIKNISNDIRSNKYEDFKVKTQLP